MEEVVLMEGSQMSMQGAYEVFALLDHANELATTDRSVDEWLLEVVAGVHLAGDVAFGQPETALELPGTVRECVSRAAATTRRWDRSELTTTADQLAMLLVDLDAGLGR